jgi:hypothetical protein
MTLNKPLLGKNSLEETHLFDASSGRVEEELLARFHSLFRNADSFGFDVLSQVESVGCSKQSECIVPDIVTENTNTQGSVGGTMSRTPEAEFVFPILLELFERHGDAQVADILQAIEWNVVSLLNPADWETLPGGEIQWRESAKQAAGWLIDQRVIEPLEKPEQWVFTEEEGPACTLLLARGSVGSNHPMCKSVLDGGCTKI